MLSAAPAGRRYFIRVEETCLTAEQQVHQQAQALQVFSALLNQNQAPGAAAGQGAGAPSSLEVR
jgi:hypothetical protein